MNGTQRMVFIAALSAVSVGCSPSAVEVCEEEVRASLKSPASAEFSRMEANRFASWGTNSVWEVKGLVDAANSYGAILRKDVYCAVVVTAKGSAVEKSFLGHENEHRFWQALRDTRRLAKRRTLPPPDVVSYDEYQHIRKGISLEVVQVVVGHEGQEVETQVVVGRTYAPKHRWENSDGSFMEVKLSSDGRVVEKYEYGLW
ncbi:MAG: hypothetical protein AAGN66_05480 [Acidobacteriota bacterium]